MIIQLSKSSFIVKLWHTRPNYNNIQQNDDERHQKAGDKFEWEDGQTDRHIETARTGKHTLRIHYVEEPLLYIVKHNCGEVSVLKIVQFDVSVVNFVSIDVGKTSKCPYSEFQTAIIL